MTTGELLSLLGIGTLCSLIVTSLFTGIKDWIKKHRSNDEQARENRLLSHEEKLDEIIQKLDQQDELIFPSIQALLRNDLYQIYNVCILRGNRTSDETANFLNLYERYHKMGKNGVMDVKEKDFLNLPLIDD